MAWALGSSGIWGLRCLRARHAALSPNLKIISPHLMLIRLLSLSLWRPMAGTDWLAAGKLFPKTWRLLEHRKHLQERLLASVKETHVCVLGVSLDQ